MGAPEGAIQGFLKSAGLPRIEDATIEKDPKQGEFDVAAIEKPGRPTAEARPTSAAVVRAFPWPKSMRGARAPTQTHAALGAPVAGNPLHARHPA